MHRNDFAYFLTGIHSLEELAQKFSAKNSDCFCLLTSVEFGKAPIAWTIREFPITILYSVECAWS